jgi:dienelactone hydrolase
MKSKTLLAITIGLFSLLTAARAQREMRDLNGYFPFTPVASAEAWAARRQEIERKVLVGSGLYPFPEKTPLQPVIHGRVERDDYTIDRVFFQSVPGHFVTGNLYLPKPLPKSPMPGVLCPHGHWPNGRFMDLGAGTAETKKQIETGAETLECAARSPLQARCVQLARMGCAVFLYDMLGYADSVQFTEHRHGARQAGFLSPQADLRLQTYFGLQTWNGVRALDFLLSLPGIDANRIGCTGASGGGTQTMMLTGIDSRITAAFPCVMVSTAMQGGCTCENTHYLRVGQGNVDIAALTAPRPLGMTAADDWTKELATKGLPDLKNLYAMLGAEDKVTAHIATQFPHNYNLPSRLAMYAFFNKHLQLGHKGPIIEKAFPFATQDELTVWTGKHAKPSGGQIGEAHEKALCAWFTEQDTRWQALTNTADSLIRKAWETIVGRKVACEVSYHVGAKVDHGSYLHIQGITRNLTYSEDVPAHFLFPKAWNGKAVLWLTLKGMTSLQDESPIPEVKKLLEEGVAIVCPQLYLESTIHQPKAGDNLKAKPDDFREFSGYTFGYNPPLLIRRVHDVFTLIAMMKTQEKWPTKVIEIRATDGAQAIALVAGAMLGDAVTAVDADPGDFTFASLKDSWNVNFVPGAVKYGDIPALRRLNMR